MHLLDFPPEVLHQIIGETRPNGFESIMQACKLLHESGKSFLELHNRLRKLRKVDINDPEHQWCNVGQLLLHLAQEPLALLYVEHLHLWDRRHSQRHGRRAWNADACDLYERNAAEWNLVCNQYQSVPQASGAKPVVDLVKSLDLFRAIGPNADAWIERIFVPKDLDMEEPDVYHPDVKSFRPTITLLNLLPNLKTLTPPCQWEVLNPESGEIDSGLECIADVWDVLDNMVTACNEKDARDAPLTQLRAILPFAHTGYDVGSGGLDCLNPFMAMPQITEMYVSGLKLVDGYTGIPFRKWRYPGFASGLQHIELLSCCISSEVETFLVHVPNLKTFKYSHETKWHGCQHDWSAGEFVAAVGKCCGHSIEELAVSIDCLYGDIETGVASMKEFTILKRLEIGARLFLGPSLESGNRQGIAGNEHKWKVQELSPLVDILPQTLEVFCLSEIWKEGDSQSETMEIVQHLFSGFQERRAAELPALQRINAVLPCGLNPKYQAAVEGIPEFLQEIGVDVQRTGSSPWRQEFVNRFLYLNEPDLYPPG